MGPDVVYELKCSHGLPNKCLVAGHDFALTEQFDVKYH